MAIIKSKFCIHKYICIFCIFLTIICVILGLQRENINFPLWLIPLVYTFFVLFQNNDDYSTPGIVVLKGIMFFRYILTPLSIYYFDKLSKFANNYNYMTESIFLLLFEMIAMMIAIKVTEKRMKKIKKSSSDSVSFYEIRGGTIFSIFIVALVIFLATRYKYLTGGLSLIISGKSPGGSESVSEVSGVVGILWQSSLAWLYIYTCLKLKKRSQKIGLPVIISLVYVLLTFIGQTSISRWYTIISFVAVLFTLLKLYPHKKKEIFLLIVLPVVFVLILVSVYKNTSYLEGGESLKESLLKLFDVSNMDSYFAGPVNVNNSIALKLSNEQLGLNTIFYDLINNFPILQKYMDKTMTSVSAYNVFIGRAWDGVTGDQIIPLIGQSSIYFSFFFAPAISVLSVIMVRWCDSHFYKCKTPMVYLYAFLGAWTAVVTILNITIFFSWIYIRVIPLAVLIKFTEKVGKKRKAGLIDGKLSKIKDI